MKFSDCGIHFYVPDAGICTKIPEIKWKDKEPCVDASGNNDWYYMYKKANAVAITSGKLLFFEQNAEVQPVNFRLGAGL